ncbi:hypothetical protein [Microvirga alba]|uniref:DUF2946 domain-containing protein n=1 Tax=Microvirga alba TaxID=2791025 RepID=A0A931BPP6_9HYPH|nr:hypothetical protein [Microvirga alba]MBF9235167.1 hypothetical protein [Microvirga alba]
MIAMLLALSMAIFPIRGVSAAVAMPPQHPAITSVGHGAHHQTAASHDCEGGADVVVSTDAGSPSRSTSHHALPASCCDMICHAITAAVAMIVSASTPFVRLPAIFSDEQVASNPSTRLERPPRTV